MFFSAQSIASKHLEFDVSIPDRAEMIADKMDEKKFSNFFAHFHHVNPPPEIGRKSLKLGWMAVECAEISVRVWGEVQIFFSDQSIVSMYLEFDVGIPDSAEMIADRMDEKKFFLLFCPFSPC